MSLPTLDIPKYETTLPFSKQKVQFRPFLVKEEKIMIMAGASNDPKEIEMAVQQVLENCTFGELDIESQAKVDIEWLVLELRRRAKGKNVELSYKCVNDVGGHECGNAVDIEVSLDSVKYVGTDTNPVIKLSNGIGIKMKALSLAEESALSTDSIQESYDRIIASIDMIFKDEEIWYPKDVSREELENFIEHFNDKQMAEVTDFVKNAPHLELPITFRCQKCGYHDNVNLEGVNNFFE